MLFVETALDGGCHPLDSRMSSAIVLRPVTASQLALWTDHMKTATAFVATVLLAGCTALGDPTEGLDVSAAGTASHMAADGAATAVEGTPKATAAGTSLIPPDLQPAFCQDQVAFMTSTEHQLVVPLERIVAADGSTTIDVTVDKGIEGVKTFKCRLDASGRFIEAMAPTNDAAP